MSGGNQGHKKLNQPTDSLFKYDLPLPPGMEGLRISLYRSSYQQLLYKKRCSAKCFSRKNNSDTVFVQGNKPYVSNNCFIECHLMTAYLLTEK